MATVSVEDIRFRNIFELNYMKLGNLILNINEISSDNKEIKLISQLKEKYSVQLLSFTPKYFDISFAHYITENNDLIPDPEFVLRIYPNLRLMEVLQYQDKFGIQKAYHSDMRINPDVKIKLNQYFAKWLDLIRKN